MLTGKIEGADNLKMSFLPSPVKNCASFSGLYILEKKKTVFRPFHFMLSVYLRFGEV